MKGFFATYYYAIFTLLMQSASNPGTKPPPKLRSKPAGRRVHDLPLFHHSRKSVTKPDMGDENKSIYAVKTDA